MNQPSDSQKPFKLEIPRDQMTAVIPKGCVISRSVEKWTLEDLKLYLRTQGFMAEVDPDDFKMLKKLSRTYPSGLGQEFTLLYGIEPTEPTPPALEWLNPPEIPVDMVFKGKAFLRLIPPVAPANGRDVQGNEVLPRQSKEIPPLQLRLSPSLIILPNDTLEALESGQVKIEGSELKFSTTYELTNASLPEFQEIEFQCDVLVHGDLAGNIKWTVNGNLTVEGHWSTPNIVVMRDATALGGIQTNMQGVLKLYGNCKANYIQMSRVGIAGNLVVENSLLLSEVRVGGDVQCKGTPGAIMGSDVDCFGSIVANKAGSDKGKPTRITLYKNTNKGKSIISSLATGTHMNVYDRVWVVATDGKLEADGENILE